MMKIEWNEDTFLKMKFMYEQRYRNTHIKLLIIVTKAISGALNVWIIDVVFIKKVQLLTFLFCAFVVLCSFFFN